MSTPSLPAGLQLDSPATNSGARVKVRHKPTNRAGTIPQHQLDAALQTGEYDKVNE